MGLPEGEKEENGRNMTENSPQINFRHQITNPEVQRTPSRINAKKTTPGHIVFKL